MAIVVGTAGWSIPRASAHLAPGDGTHLQRYARQFHGTEINSSFHRPHAVATYERWSLSTPADFRFAVKAPRTITHERKLRATRLLLDQFFAETSGLGVKRGPILVQLPPSLAFEVRSAGRFFELVRAGFEGDVVCEPRHESWFGSRADALLRRHRVARVAADPAVVPGAERPGGWEGVVYYRLHGSPRKYWSAYEPAALTTLAADLRRRSAACETWCVFDNTASGAAFANAWDLQALCSRGHAPGPD